MRSSVDRNQQGFTLIEMLVIAPIVMLMIGAFILVIVTLTGDALRGRELNAMTYNVQDALNRIEADVYTTSSFKSTTGTLPSPQGSNNSTAAFNATTGYITPSTSSASSPLILNTYATTQNPTSPNRTIIYYNSPRPCNDSAVSLNEFYPVTIVYFLRDNSLWRRTIMGPTNNGTCNTAWQRASCYPGYTNTSVCKTNDEKILDNVVSIRSRYYASITDSTPNDIAASASAVSVTIQTSKQVSGQAVEYTSSMIAASVNGRRQN